MFFCFMIQRPLKSTLFPYTTLFRSVFEREFNSLLYATYLGGNASKEHVDGGTSRFDKNGVVYQAVCGGCWANSDFPTSPDAWSNNNLSTGCNALTLDRKSVV